MKYSPVFAICLALAVSAHPLEQRAAFTKQNGKDAIALNKKFAGLSKSSSCTAGENACVGTDFAQCVNGKFVTTSCGSGETCAALPLVNSAGTSITCTTAADRDARIQATGAQGGGSSAPSPRANNAAAGVKGSSTKTTSSAKSAGTQGSGSKAGAKGSGTKTTSSAKSAGTQGSGSKGGASSGAGNDPQKSLTLDPSVIAKGFEQDGQATQEPNQVASLTSSNNFINFCAGTGETITNGKQVADGSCNPAPMGSIPSAANMPSAKFQFPKNLDTIPANKEFTVQMAIQGMETGNFVNAQQNYFAAPQQLNSKGQIIGHSHVVIEKINSLTQTTPTDPQKFAFFLGLNTAAVNGVLTADVTKGLPAGTYRLGSINTAANHQPCLVPVAQHGMLDDAVYFTVSDNGAAAGGASGATGGGKGAGKSAKAPAAAATETSGGKKSGGKKSGGQNRRWA